MTNQELQEAMGSMATEAEAVAMADLLKEKDIDPEGLSDEEFFALIPVAITRTWRSKMAGTPE